MIKMNLRQLKKLGLFCCMWEMWEDGLFKKYIASPSYGSLNRCIICIFLSVSYLWKYFTKLVEKVETIWLKGLASSCSVLLVKTQGSDLKKRGKGHQWVFVWIVDWWGLHEVEIISEKNGFGLMQWSLERSLLGRRNIGCCNKMENLKT